MMNRRRFLANAALTSVGAITASKFAHAETASIGDNGWRTFEVTTTVDLANVPGPARLWLPVIQSSGDYQRAERTHWRTTSDDVGLKKDAPSAADILAVDWNGPGERSIEVVQLVSTRNRTSHDVVAASAAELDHERQPSPSMPTDGIVRETAMKIVGSRGGEEEKARAIYEWVIENTFRDANVNGCGVGNVKDMLESGYFGGKCADINSLFVALARAAGLPARDVFGIRVADSAEFKSLGRAGDITKAQHCRAEVHITNRGWVAVDPADVRKVVLEEKLPLDNPAVQAFREKAFGNWEMNWVGFNTARDLVLPGSSERQGFLMYPAAYNSKGEVDCLSPKTFAYTIMSREITA